MKPAAYPLVWPAGWPRTNYREFGRFKSTLPSALNQLKDEVRLLGGKNLILSSNCTLGDDRPNDPGVVAYFQWQGVDLAVPCDRWSRVNHNVQAIALTIEAMRGMERWGAKHMIRAMFTGFKALPAPSKSPWWDVMGIEASSPLSAIETRYKDLAKVRHPDCGGSHEAFVELQNAFNEGIAQRKAA